MKSLRIFAVLSIATCLLYSCSTSKSKSGSKSKTGITDLRPNVSNPGRGVINATGDALTPGINSVNNNSAGSEENAINIANSAINKASAAARSGQPDADSLSNTDFLNKSTDSDLMEMSRSKAAQKATKNAKIKSFATMILSDHQQLQKDLSKLAISNKISLPPAVDTAAHSNQTDLQYVQTMIQDHQTMLNLFMGATNSKNPQISAFAVKYLPLLRKHLTAAQELTKEVSPN